MLNSIDLFSGCGGMTLGFGWAGFNSVLAKSVLNRKFRLP